MNKKELVNKLVVHCRRQHYDVYIGRPSKWGNPFVIGKDGNRNEVIWKYHNWLVNQPNLLNDVKKELKGKVLGCWCDPETCHGHILAAIANFSEQEL